MGICLGMSLEEKVEILQCTPLYELDHLKLASLAKYFRTITTLDEQTIFLQDEPGDQFFVIAEGEVEVSVVYGHSGEAYTLCTKHKGDFFGDQALFDDNHVRNVNVETTSECLFLVLSRKDFLKFLRNQSDETNDKVAGIMRKGMQDVLKKLPFLLDVDEHKLNILSSLFQYVTVPQGEIIFRQGDEGDKMFVVAQGSVIVLATGADGEEREMATLGPGVHFGEIALMVNMPRTATVMAKENSLLLSITKDFFRNFMTLLPEEIERDFDAAMRQRTAELFKLFQVPFFEAIPEKLFMNIANVCEVCQYQSKQIIYEEGEIGSSFYIVINGVLDATVQKNDKKLILRQYFPGTYFGELALVRQQINRPATVTALTDCALLCFTRKHFDDFFKQFPEHRAPFEVKLAKQDASIEAVLGTDLGLKYFTKHLKNEFSVENIRFWSSVQMYRDLSDDDRKEMVDTIVNAFIKVNASQEVNISAKQRQAILVRVEKNDFARDLFDTAAEEVVLLMKRDSLPRFKQTTLFQNFLIDIGAVEEPEWRKHTELSEGSELRRDRSATAAAFGRLMAKKRFRISTTESKAISGSDINIELH